MIHFGCLSLLFLLSLLSLPFLRHQHGFYFEKNKRKYASVLPVERSGTAANCTRLSPNFYSVLWQLALPSWRLSPASSADRSAPWPRSGSCASTVTVRMATCSGRRRELCGSCWRNKWSWCTWARRSVWNKPPPKVGSPRHLTERPPGEGQQVAGVTNQSISDVIAEFSFTFTFFRVILH